MTDQGAVDVFDVGGQVPMSRAGCVDDDCPCGESGPPPDPFDGEGSDG